MAWLADEFGESHAGYAGATLADGSEPKEVYLDLGSGASMPSTREWWAYTGHFGRPKAAAVRGACACGWRGPAYPLDWDALDADDEDMEEKVPVGPYTDWADHIETVEHRTVPLPAQVAELIDRLNSQLHALADEHPAAALRAVASLERLARETGYSAAVQVDIEDDEDWVEGLAQSLGISPDRARSRVHRYLLGKL